MLDSVLLVYVIKIAAFVIFSINYGPSSLSVTFVVVFLMERFTLKLPLFQYIPKFIHLVMNVTFCYTQNVTFICT